MRLLPFFLLTAVALTGTAAAQTPPTDAPSAADSASAEQAKDNRLTRFVSNLKTISANFVQIQNNRRGQERKQSSGHFTLSRPGQFNWVYEKPYVQRLVSSNGTLWVYDPDLQQATRSKLSDAKGAPISILLGTEPLSSVFNILALGKDSQGKLDWFRMTYKTRKSDFNQVLIGMDAKGIKVMEFTDALNNVTQIEFSQRIFNQPVDSKQFDFTPPKGVDVVEAKH